MKVAVIFALVACVAACYSAPAPRAVDWAAVCDKFEQIAAQFTDSMNKIKIIATNDNAAVGSELGDELDAAVVKAKLLLGQAEAECKDQSLTEAEVKALFSGLKDILAGAQQDIQDELAKLSAAAVSFIRDEFYIAYAAVEAIAQEIYALLRQ